MPLFASTRETAKILEDYETEEDLANEIRNKIPKNGKVTNIDGIFIFNLCSNCDGPALGHKTDENKPQCS